MLQNARSDVPVLSDYIFFFHKDMLNALEHAVTHTSVAGPSDFNMVGFDCEYC